MTTTKSICCYCGTGCGILIHHEDGRITNVEGDPDHPANFGRLCTKGSTLHLAAAEQTTRALHPELRTNRDQPRQRTTWDAALDEAASRFASIIREHGPDAVAFYVSGQLLTEDYFAFNKLARALVGTNNIDSNSRLCMSSAVAGYKATLGADAPPCSYEDLALADCVLVAGANPAIAHPIAFRRVLDAKAARPEMKLIVIDPRRTETAASADLHLQVEPGTDAILFSAMLHALIWDGLTDAPYIAAHTLGFAAARDAVREITPAFAARVCGVNEADIVTAARWFGAAGAALSLWCQGLNQSTHGTANNAALIHLHLATGQIGRPGAGPFSLTGQPNAMGGRETGTMANLLPGHRDAGSAEDRAEVAAHWGLDELPASPGKTAVELFDALADGTIKAVWIACTNPAQSLPDQARVAAALARAEFVVVQEAYADTETCAFADLLLPAASWGEKDGSMTSSERRISRLRAAVPAPGEARPDWQIATDFARRLGSALGRDDAPRLFPWTTPEQIFAEHAALTAGRDLDFATFDYARLDAEGPQQWPVAVTGTPRLYTDGRFAHADGRARFVPITLARTAEATDAQRPLALNSGRLRDQWHGMSRTGTVPRLGNAAPEATLALHPADIARRGLAAGELVGIAGRRGRIVLPLVADANLKPGHAFVPMHWGRARLGHAGVNALTTPACDPVSKQPELKHAAVAVEALTLPWRGEVLFAPGDVATALAARVALAQRLDRFSWASLSLLGREQPLLALRLAAAHPPEPALLAEIDAIVGLATPQTLHFDDARRRIHKRARIDGERLAGITLYGETAALPWLREAMLNAQDARPLRRWLFAPRPDAPVDCGPRPQVLCQCLDISDADIAAAVASGVTRFEILQERLRCGTGCGGCVPAIRQKFSALLAAAQPA